jgi:hypothetical protein
MHTVGSHLATSTRAKFGRGATMLGRGAITDVTDPSIAHIVPEQGGIVVGEVPSPNQQQTASRIANTSTAS